MRLLNFQYIREIVTTTACRWKQGVSSFQLKATGSRFEVLPQNPHPASGILTGFPFDIG